MCAVQPRLDLVFGSHAVCFPNNPSPPQLFPLLHTQRTADGSADAVPFPPVDGFYCPEGASPICYLPIDPTQSSVVGAAMGAFEVSPAAHVVGHVVLRTASGVPTPVEDTGRVAVAVTGPSASEVECELLAVEDGATYLYPIGCQSTVAGAVSVGVTIDSLAIGSGLAVTFEAKGADLDATVVNVPAALVAGGESLFEVLFYDEYGNAAAARSAVVEITFVPEDGVERDAAEVEDTVAAYRETVGLRADVDRSDYTVTVAVDGVISFNALIVVEGDVGSDGGEFPIELVAAAGGGGLVLIVVLAVVVAWCCCCREKKGSGKGGSAWQRSTVSAPDETVVIMTATQHVVMRDRVIGMLEHRSTEVIGRGGFATVFKARESKGGEFVAIKVLSPNATAAAMEEFQQV